VEGATKVEAGVGEGTTVGVPVDCAAVVSERNRTLMIRTVAFMKFRREWTVLEPFRVKTFAIKVSGKLSRGRSSIRRLLCLTAPKAPSSELSVTAAEHRFKYPMPFQAGFTLRLTLPGLRVLTALLAISSPLVCCSLNYELPGTAAPSVFAC
jgi:hypothetical protein